MPPDETIEQIPPSPDGGEAPPEAVPWTIRDVLVGTAFLTVLAVLLLSGLVAAALLLNMKGAADRILLSLYVTLLLDVLMLAIVWNLTVRKYRVRWRTLGFKSLGGRAFVAAWAVVGAGLVISVVYGAVVSLLKLDALKSPPLPPIFSAGGWSWVLGGVLVLVMAPIAEETFFRGFVFTGISQRFGFWWGAGISAILFAVAHAQLGALIPVFVLGLFLAWLYSRTQSLWSCILAHFLYNGLVLAVAR